MVLPVLIRAPIASKRVVVELCVEYTRCVKCSARSSGILVYESVTLSIQPTPCADFTKCTFALMTRQNLTTSLSNGTRTMRLLNYYLVFLRAHTIKPRRLAHPVTHWKPGSAKLLLLFDSYKHLHPLTLHSKLFLRSLQSAIRPRYYMMLHSAHIRAWLLLPSLPLAHFVISHSTPFPWIA